MTSQGMTPPASLSSIALEVTDRLPSHSSSGTEDLYGSASGSANASLEQESSVTSPRHKPVETSGSASVEHENITFPVSYEVSLIIYITLHYITTLFSIILFIPRV